MFDWEWEIFCSFLKEGNFKVCESSYLSLPVKNFLAKRDEDLNIIIETDCEENVKMASTLLPKGSVYESEGVINFTNETLLVTGTGGFLLRYRYNHDIKNGKYYLRETSLIKSIKSKIKKESHERYLIEWLVNVDDHYIWPDSIFDKIEIKYTRELNTEETSLPLIGNEKTGDARIGCLNILVNGLNLYLGTCKNVPIDKNKMPGFILYDGCPSPEVREKIRECISFVFGQPLVYIGHTIFDSNWETVSFEAITPYNSMSNKAFYLNTLPPSPLSQSSDLDNKKIDRVVFSNMVNSLYSKYEEYDLQLFNWLYWHAECAPVHMQAVNFGAAFEALQRVFLSTNKNLSLGRLIDDKKWKIIRNSISKVISELDIQEDILKILKSNIDSSNRAPQKIIMNRLSDKLNIKFSKKEIDTWNQRNKNAHGAREKKYTLEEIIINSKVIKLLCHRLLLKMTGSNSHYFDYSTVDFPKRKVEEPSI